MTDKTEWYADLSSPVIVYSETEKCVDNTINVLRELWEKHPHTRYSAIRTVLVNLRMHAYAYAIVPNDPDDTETTTSYVVFLKPEAVL